MGTESNMRLMGVCHVLMLSSFIHGIAAECYFDDRQLENRTALDQQNGTSGTDYSAINPRFRTWNNHNGIIRVGYYFSKRNPTDRERRVMHEAFNLMHQNTRCLYFYERDGPGHKNVNIKLNNACGYGGGSAWFAPPTLTMGSKCCNYQQEGYFKGTFLHEWFHIFGIAHMQKRTDRDRYVKIHENNMKPGWDIKFQFYPCTGCPIYGPYECESIMHYDETAFTRNGKATITAIDDNRCSRMGGNVPTPNDWAALRHAIGCPWPGDRKA